MFQPQQVFIQQDALNYPLGRELARRFHELEPVIYQKRIPAIRGLEPREKFQLSKKTLVVSLWQGREFQSCRPSAHWQLPLVSGCPGHCHYCYLHTNLGTRPFINVRVNIEEILKKASSLCKEMPKATVFEGAATSDPVAVEHLTGALAKTIEFFAQQPHGRFRFVTKFPYVESFLELEHRQKTEIRFSINCQEAIAAFEKGVPSLKRRIKAAGKAAEANYPTGFLIGPLFVFPQWKEAYERMLKELSVGLPEGKYTFELISHRFTLRARQWINTLYPENKVPMDEEKRQFKFGQFGYGKYLYPKAQRKELEDFFREKIRAYFPQSDVLYFV
ncbi:MAG: spore photoproduct lyase [Firmicutes bacterium]|nr:spore photoproduct lyase [Bacillota bacterium]